MITAQSQIDVTQLATGDRERAVALQGATRDRGFQALQGDSIQAEFHRGGRAFHGGKSLVFEINADSR